MNLQSLDWDTLIKLAVLALNKKQLGDEYQKRLDFEIKEVEKQGAGDYWVRKVRAKEQFDHNKHGLVLPWLLGLTKIDPVESKIDHQIEYQPDYPDIDLDFLPIARGPIRQHAADTYGEEYVCSVGLWQTYHPKLALADAARALGQDADAVIRITRNLPEQFDEMSFEEAYDDSACSEFKTYANDYPDVVKMAYRMVNLIKAQGRHAGGIIISSVPIKDYVPLTFLRSAGGGGYWTSAWTEGRNAQLSKFGFVKFDFLGLKTMLYIWKCKKLLKQIRGIDVDFTDMDPDDGRAGWETLPDGTRNKISFNHQDTLLIGSELKTDSIFQFDTDLAKRIIAQGGVKSFYDLVIYTSLGRPGPLPMIDVYIKNRDSEPYSDGTYPWMRKENPEIVKILKDTHGVIVFQEQLADIWKRIAGFTAPEAEAARKAVAKKWVDKLVPIRDKWIKGAEDILGHDVAKEWWDRMESFGRYAFNKSHATAYTIISYRCMWLKAKYPEEWWAAVMSDCDPNRLVRYMGIARSEGSKFDTINCDHIASDFTVSKKTDGSCIISPGIVSVKGIGESVAKNIADENSRHHDDFDDFATNTTSSKTVCERLVKLGAFDAKHSNRKALWYYYLYAYGVGKESTEAKRHLRSKHAWPLSEIEKERHRQGIEFKKLYPKKKIPPKIANWKPKTPYHGNVKIDFDMTKPENYKLFNKIKIDLSNSEAVIEDYAIEEILKFEKEWLGYYIHSPLTIYKNNGHTIEDARTSGTLEVVIESASKRKKNTEFWDLSVTDGVESARVMVWSREAANSGNDVFQVGAGVKMCVAWKEKFRSFNVERGTSVVPLLRTDDPFLDN